MKSSDEIIRWNQSDQFDPIDFIRRISSEENVPKGMLIARKGQ
jgi:hypothetical protein